VILADDHVRVIEALQRLLENDCDLVATVSDGRSLVEAALQLAHDIIITDLSMPVLDGLEALRQLKQHGVRSRVIVLTAELDPAMAVRALVDGADGYVLKLSAHADLLKAVAHVSLGLTYISPLIRAECVERFVQAARSRDKDLR
jgi:DNA-binding NarL/FixJ family response regulator